MPAVTPAKAEKAAVTGGSQPRLSRAAQATANPASAPMIQGPKVKGSTPGFPVTFISRASQPQASPPNSAAINPAMTVRPGNDSSLNTNGVKPAVTTPKASQIQPPLAKSFPGVNAVAANPATKASPAARSGRKWGGNSPPLRATAKPTKPPRGHIRSAIGSLNNNVIQTKTQAPANAAINPAAQARHLIRHNIGSRAAVANPASAPGLMSRPS